MDQDKIKTAVRMLLEAIGEDPDRDGLKETPRRIAELFEDLYGGLARDPAGVLKIYPTGAEHEIRFSEWPTSPTFRAKVELPGFLSW